MQSRISLRGMSHAFAVGPEFITLVRALGASRLQVALKVVLLGSIPYVFSGLCLAMNLSIGAAVVGELVTAQRRIGVLISNASSVLDTTSVMAGVILTMLLALVITVILTLAEERILRWRRV